jgi:hypothetical protein
VKKVRYIFGVVGVTPALGLMVPTVNAAAAVTQTPKNAAKVVSQVHRAVPLTNCGRNHKKTATSPDKHLHGSIVYSGVCVFFQSALLNKAQTGLTERTRFYSGGGTLERTTWQAGTIFSNDNHTYFKSSPNSFAHEVCQALVENAHRSVVKYGPICETT